MTVIIMNCVSVASNAFFMSVVLSVASNLYILYFCVAIILKFSCPPDKDDLYL